MYIYIQLLVVIYTYIISSYIELISTHINPHVSPDGTTGTTPKRGWSPTPTLCSGQGLLPAPRLPHCNDWTTRKKHGKKPCELLCFIDSTEKSPESHRIPIFCWLSPKLYPMFLGSKLLDKSAECHRKSLKNCSPTSMPIAPASAPFLRKAAEIELQLAERCLNHWLFMGFLWRGDVWNCLGFSFRHVLSVAASNSWKNAICVSCNGGLVHVSAQRIFGPHVRQEAQENNMSRLCKT